MGDQDRLELTEDEAYSLLSLCMMSDLPLDGQSEKAIKKLAEFCKSHKFANRNHTKSVVAGLYEAG